MPWSTRKLVEESKTGISWLKQNGYLGMLTSGTIDSGSFLTPIRFEVCLEKHGDNYLRLFYLHSFAGETESLDYKVNHHPLHLRWRALLVHMPAAN